MIAKTSASLLLVTSLATGLVTGATVVFKDGSDVLSSDSLINIPDYQGTQDSTLIQDQANNNYGGRTEILLGPTGPSRQRAGLIRFDVTSMNGLYQSIDSITVRFTVFRLGGTASSTWNLNLLRPENAAWTEGTENGNPQVGSPSWNYISYDPTTPTDWAGGRSGARLFPQDIYGALGSMTFVGSTAEGDVFDIVLNPASLDPSVDTLTEIIDLWSGGTNPGIQIYGGNGQWGVDSSDSGTLANRPELIIEYTAIPEPSALILLLGSTLGLFRRSRKAIP